MQAVLRWIDSRWPRPPWLTDSGGRGQRRQRHGGVFVRVCGTVLCGECVIEVPQLIIVPLFGAGVRGAEEQPDQVILHLHIYSACTSTVSLCGWLCIDIAIVASSVLAFFSACGGWDGDRQMGARMFFLNALV